MQEIILQQLFELLTERFANAVSEKLSQKEKFSQQEKPKQDLQIEFLSIKDTCKLLGVTKPTLHNWTKSGKVTGYRISTRIRYKREEIENSVKQIKTNG
jgi:excisionase family DNA binding protein